MAFKFTLQKVLEYREVLENQAKVAFSKAQANYLEALKRLEELNVLLESQQAELCNPKKEVSEKWLVEQYIKGIREDIVFTARLLPELEKKKNEAQQELIIKAKELKTLEKLKEKQHERFNKEELKKEQKAYDETASVRFKNASF